MATLYLHGALHLKNKACQLVVLIPCQCDIQRRSRVPNKHLIMRRTSGSVTPTVAGSHPPQVGAESALWWESRLLPYRAMVLFLWSGLTFTPSFLSGAAIWALSHIFIMSLFQLSGCVLEVWGNLLVLTAILYALLHLGLRYGNLTLVPEWNGDCDQKFHEICSLLAVSGQLFTGSVSTVLQMRFSNPKKFYSWGLLISFLLYQLGCWLPTAVCLHGILCVLLLLPLALERYKPQSEDLRDKSHRAWVELSQLVNYLLHRLQERFRNIRSRSK